MSNHSKKKQNKPLSKLQSYLQSLPRQQPQHSHTFACGAIFEQNVHILLHKAINRIKDKAIDNPIEVIRPLSMNDREILVKWLLKCGNGLERATLFAKIRGNGEDD